MGLTNCVAGGKQVTQSLADSTLGLQGRLAQLAGLDGVQRTAQAGEWFREVLKH